MKTETSETSVNQPTTTQCHHPKCKRHYGTDIFMQFVLMLVQKVYDLGPGKQSSVSGWLQYLIPVKVGPL
jgi:hypothetical protein